MPTVAAAARAGPPGAKRAGVGAVAVILQGSVGVILTHPARVVAKIARHVSVLGAELIVFWHIHRGIPLYYANPDTGDGARGAWLGRGSNAPAVAICVGNLATDLWRPQLREPFALNHRGWPNLAAAGMSFNICRGTLGSLAMFTATTQGGRGNYARFARRSL
jgi:hypothetical protein